MYSNLKTTCYIKPHIFLWTKLHENLPLTKYLISVATPLISMALREKCPNTEFFLIRIFSHSAWIQRDASHLSVFTPNAWKYVPEKTPYLDTFHTVWVQRKVWGKDIFYYKNTMNFLLNLVKKWNWITCRNETINCRNITSFYFQITCPYFSLLWKYSMSLKWWLRNLYSKWSYYMVKFPLDYFKESCKN